MAILVGGNTEQRIVYKNIELNNLNSNQLDPSHEIYVKYLQNHFFIPRGERKYFQHSALNVLPTTPSTDANKGLFNVFGVDLTSLEPALLKTPASSLGKKKRERIRRRRRRRRT